MTEPNITEVEPLVANEGDSSVNTALLILVPIFLACYCGSCLVYMIYKIYRNCYHRQTKPRGINLDVIEAPATDGRAPPAFPAYLQAPAKPDTLDGGLTKSPPRYESENAVGGPLDDEAGGIPIAEILMKKMEQKSSVN